MNSPNIDDFYLLNDILERNYFSYFRKGIKNLELILSSNTFNLSTCSDCALQTSELYPNQNIFTPTLTNKFENLLLIIDWYIKNDFVCDIEFNGCLEEENHEHIYNALKNMLKKFKEVKYNKHPNKIIFHTRMQDLNFIQSIEKLFQDSNIKPIFYIHLNGYYCDNNKYTENYYSAILDYTSGNSAFYYKTIIDSNNINQWIQNYQWWISKIGLNNFISQMILEETLNDKWSYESINEYMNFLNFQIEFLSENFKDFNSYIFKSISDGFSKPFTIQILDQEILTNKKYYQNCSFHNSVVIDLITLKIPICCQLNYPIYHLGEFKIQNEQLIIEPLNLSVSIPKAHLKRSSTPHCEYCFYLNLCEKTCYGENFKISYNPLCPIKESCLLAQHKYHFLISKYQQMNLFNLDNYDLSEAFKKDIAQILRKINKKGN